MWTAIIEFLTGLFAGIKARGAAKAGGELAQGDEQVRAVDANVKTIERELTRKPAMPPN